MSSLVDFLQGRGNAALLRRKLGLHPSTLSKVKAGVNPISIELVLRAYVATNGAVSPGESLPDQTEFFRALRELIIKEYKDETKHSSST